MFGIGSIAGQFFWLCVILFNLYVYTNWAFPVQLVFFIAEIIFFIVFFWWVFKDTSKEDAEYYAAQENDANERWCNYDDTLANIEIRDRKEAQRDIDFPKEY